MMTLPVFILIPLLLASLTVLGVAGDNEQLAREFKPILETLVQKNKLKYDEPCDHSVELEKGKHEKALIEMMSNLNLKTGANQQKLVDDLLRITNSIASIPGTFCNGYANLQCTPKGVCGCATLSETYGFKMSFKRDGNACLIVGGSICAPPEVMEQSRKNNPLFGDVPAQEFRCSDKAKCVVKSDGKVCTLESMKAEFERFIRTEMSPNSDPIEFIVKKTKQGVCVCKGISFVASMALVFLSAMFVFVKSASL